LPTGLLSRTRHHCWPADGHFAALNTTFEHATSLTFSDYPCDKPKIAYDSMQLDGERRRVLVIPGDTPAADHRRLPAFATLTRGYGGQAPTEEHQGPCRSLHLLHGPFSVASEPDSVRR
jgi:hypothetical protein